MATDPQTLISQGNCYDCYLPQFPLLELALLRQILLAKNPNAVTDPQTLVSQAACYDCYLPQYPLMVLALLSQIAQSGGSSSTCVTGGNTPPVGVPPCNYSVWIQGPGPNFGVWFGDTNGWSSVAAIAQGP